MCTTGLASHMKGASCAFFCFCALLAARASGADERARWFMPGPLGYEAPSDRNAKVQGPDSSNEESRHDETVRPREYLTRTFAGLESPEEKEWGQENGLTQPLAFLHNLNRIISPNLYHEHPEYFPLVGGTRLEPPTKGQVIWQPDLGNPTVAEYGARVAEEFFNTNPTAKAFSLGVNDALIFGESPETLALVTPTRWFRGRPDYSNLVFTFTNRAADDVAQKFPNKLLGCLAYYWCENTPSFPVRPNVVPFLTADRSQGYDPIFRHEELDLQSRWGHSGPRRLGLYDYLEGRGFLVPRIFTRLVAESLRHARASGFTDYYAESFPNWGLDGPQPWLVAQLLQDPQQSAGKLLTEYYNRYFGPAAKPMWEYFERCEAQWMGQPGSAEWLKYFHDEAQAVLFPSPVCRELRGLLDEARKAAGGGERRYAARVAFVGDAFGLTERLVAMAEAGNRLASSVLKLDSADPGRHPGAAQELLGQLERYAAARAEFRRYAAWLAAQEPLAVHPFDEEDYLRSDPGSAAVWAALGAAELEGPAAVRATLRRAEALPDYEAAVTGWQNARAMRQAGRNASLEGPATPARMIAGLAFGLALPAEWISRAEPVQDFTATLEPDAAHTGRQGLRLRGAEDAALYQWVPALPGAVYRARVAVRGQVSSWTKVQVTLGWLDGEQKHLGGALTMRLPAGAWSGWVELSRTETAPPAARWVGIGLRIQHQPGGDWLDADDLVLEEVPGPAAGPPDRKSDGGQ